jgi:predicted phosphodiesterase
MTIYGVISDIHGNAEALRAALAFLDAQRIAEILCLGDVVGVGAEFRACIELLRARPTLAIAGNHDLVATGRIGVEDCDDEAAPSLRHTRRALTKRERRCLSELPLVRRAGAHVVIVHGSFHDPRDYVTSEASVVATLEAMEAAHPGSRICFHGHTHAAALWESRGGRARRVPITPEVRLHFEGDAKYLVNPGSIDASRKADGSRLAELAIYDGEARTLQFIAVPYDHATAERRAVEAGFRRRPNHTLLDRMRSMLEARMRPLTQRAPRGA